MATEGSAGMMGWGLALAFVGLARAAVEGVDDVLEMAEAMRESGAPDNCVSLLNPVETLIAPEQAEDYYYLRGFCSELAWGWNNARLDYERVITLHGAREFEARFRLALVLEDLGDGPGALRQMTILNRDRGWSLDDQVAIDLEHALSLIAAGKLRRGARELDAALIVAQSWDKHPYLRAKALYTQVDLALDALEGPLRGREVQLRRRVGERVEGLAWAQNALLPIVAIEEPEWILRGLYRLAEGYLAFGEAIGSAPAPRLSAEQALVYADGVRAEQRKLDEKAHHVLDQAVQLALRLRFESPWLAKITLLRDRLELRLGA